MIWYAIALALFVLAVALLAAVRIRDRRYERKRASEAMRPELMSEIEEERAAIEARHEKFRRALKEAEGNPAKDS